MDCIYLCTFLKDQSNGMSSARHNFTPTSGTLAKVARLHASIAACISASLPNHFTHRGTFTPILLEVLAHCAIHYVHTMWDNMILVLFQLQCKTYSAVPEDATSRNVGRKM